MKAAVQQHEASPRDEAARALAPPQGMALADASPRLQPLRALGQLVANSPRVQQQRALAQAVDTSPRMVAQRVLVDTGNGLFLNFSWVMHANGAMVLTHPDAVPTHWPHYFDGALGEWVFYAPQLVPALPLQQDDEDEGQAAADALPEAVPDEAVHDQAPLGQAVGQGDEQGQAEQGHAEEGQAEEDAEEDAEDQGPQYNTVQDLMDHARYVEQDYGDDNYYIGTAVAYTYNLSTCTAVAMYHAGTGLSYLRHADAGTEPDQVRASVVEFLAAVLEDSEQPVDLANDIEVTIYATNGAHNRQSSFNQVRDGILAVAANDVVLNLFAHATIREGMRTSDHIVVGGGVAPGTMDPGHSSSTLEYVLRRIIAGADADEEVYDASFVDVLTGAWRWPEKPALALLHDQLQEALERAEEDGLDAEAEVLRKILSGEEYPTDYGPPPDSDDDDL